ncbi:MAG: radical SAM protein [Candidatus Caenarcaniphilales bacterium]|nr:radical SAM protein [Candidatus Caenarcaniphilales bacterium]
MQFKKTNVDLSSEIHLFTSINGSEINVLNCFPNSYEVGMASLGYQFIYRLYGEHERVSNYRYFTNFNERYPRDIHLVSFSISWELDFINLIKILRELNIPLLSKDRDSSHPLIYGGGPVLTANPEPWAEFFDFIAIGDCENNIDGIVDATVRYYEAGAERQAWQENPEVNAAENDAGLAIFQKVPGIYVPSLYKPIYFDYIDAGDNEIENKSEDQNYLYDENFYKAIDREKSKPEQLSHSSVIAPNAYWQNTGLLEVVRSCPEMCRFCLASYLTLPFRKPDIDSVLIRNLEYLLEFTDSIGLLGPSVTQHPEFISILKYLKNHPKNPKTQVASVRAGTVTKEMTGLLVELGVKNLTIAIESGSERMRHLINKKLPEEDIFNAAKAASESGIKAMKLYGMVGMPYETEDDIDATVDLLKRLKKANPKLKITWGCSIFTPKAQTPFQNIGVDKSSEKKLKKITKALRPVGIEVRPESYKWTQIQALISRGDRSLYEMFLEIVDLDKDEPAYSDYKKAVDKEKFEKLIFSHWNKENFKFPWLYLMTESQIELLSKHAKDAQDKADIIFTS